MPFYFSATPKHYFASIKSEILKEILVRKFKDPDLIWLLNTIIDSAQSDQPEKGIPIGSLTSQHFANLYLDRLDHHIKDSLRIKGYLRYMDDFILFCDEKDDLYSLHVSTMSFLHNELELELKCIVMPEVHRSRMVCQCVDDDQTAIPRRCLLAGRRDTCPPPLVGC
ncbi:MAG TPA: RNA-directed DNA polymerase [Methanophagales archaeon]|nr:RNA-directed DNA polymerase [Methanophagales archaeon]